MTAKMFLLVPLLLLLTSPIDTSASENADAQTRATELVLSILDDNGTYDNSVRPSNDSGPVAAKFQIYLRNIVVDDVKMKISVDMTYRFVWTDKRLKYSMPGVDNVTLVDAHKIWLPDPFFKNSVSVRQMACVYDETYIRIHQDGRIIFSTRMIVDLSCPMDLKRFPHDIQFCTIEVASYGYTKEHMLFQIDTVEVSPELNNLKKFVFADHKVDYCEDKTTTGDYPCVSVVLEMHRDFLSYFIEWYIPCIFLVIVAWFSELIPADAILPKLILTVTPLITLATLSSAYTSGMAPVNYTRALDIFTGISLLIIFSTLVHVIGAYYRITSKEGTCTESLDTVFQRCLSSLSKHYDILSRIVIIGVYLLFLLTYFAAYCSYN